MSRAVASPSAASTSELRAHLERALGRHFGSPRRIVGLDRRPSPYRTSFALEELAVELEDGSRLELMFKDLAEAALDAEARQAKPPFLVDPLREIEVYRRLLATTGLPTATCYGAAVSPEDARYWLFLEKVPGVELYQVGERGTWEEAARWLAVMHDRLRPERVAPGATDRLVRYDADFFLRWPRRALSFAALEPPKRRWLASIAGRYERVVERLLALPATVIHGEFYASNVLVSGARGALRVCPVDWEVAAVGPALIDVAALTAGRWSEADRRAIALAYHRSLPERPGPIAAQDAFLEALEVCRLHLAMQWLGWAPNWTPPAEHAHDWLGEALRLGECLGL